MAASSCFFCRATINFIVIIKIENRVFSIITIDIKIIIDAVMASEARRTASDSATVCPIIMALAYRRRVEQNHAMESTIVRYPVDHEENTVTSFNSTGKETEQHTKKEKPTGKILDTFVWIVIVLMWYACVVLVFCTIGYTLYISYLEVEQIYRSKFLHYHSTTCFQPEDSSALMFCQECKSIVDRGRFALFLQLNRKYILSDLHSIIDYFFGTTENKIFGLVIIYMFTFPIITFLRR